MIGNQFNHHLGIQGMMSINKYIITLADRKQFLPEANLLSNLAKLIGNSSSEKQIHYYMLSKKILGGTGKVLVTTNSEGV